MDRNAQSVLHQRRRSIERRARSTEAVEFFNMLTSPELLETTEAQLPLEMVSALTRQTGRLLSQKALAPWLWRGRAVKLVDGTGLSMPDTPENQALYPRPSTQAPGVGFPLARLVAVICLATGAALNAAIGPHRGKGSGELGLVRGLLEGFRPGDVMLADALYCNYFLIATLMATRAVRAKRSAHHRLSTRFDAASRWARATTSCAGPSPRPVRSG